MQCSYICAHINIYFVEEKEENIARACAFVFTIIVYRNNMTNGLKYSTRIFFMMNNDLFLKMTKEIQSLFKICISCESFPTDKIQTGNFSLLFIYLFRSII